MLKDVKREDLEVYMGKWFAKTDKETDELRHLLSNGKSPKYFSTLVMKDGITQERLKELGLQLVYEMQPDRRKRWTIINAENLQNLE